MGLLNKIFCRKECTSVATENHSDIFTNLSNSQKFAMFTMLSSLAAAPSDIERAKITQKMIFTDSSMMGLTESMLVNYIRTHNRPTIPEMMTVLSSIKNKSVLEWLMYCGFGIITVNRNEKALNLYYNWWNQLGYDYQDVNNIILKVEKLCSIMK